ncbi:hypothetical protein HDU93_002728 [Gonapodya sp. JEL0774]|nr:hypothetical protein HDU93_002728 [Gonapodya sp. JEL0774]
MNSFHQCSNTTLQETVTTANPRTYSYTDYVPAHFPKHGVLTHAGWMIYTPALTVTVGLVYRLIESQLAHHYRHKSLSPTKLHSASLHLSNILFYTISLACITHAKWPEFFPHYFINGDVYFEMKDPSKAFTLMLGGAVFAATLLWDVCARRQGALESRAVTVSNIAFVHSTSFLSVMSLIAFCDPPHLSARPGGPDTHSTVLKASTSS